MPFVVLSGVPGIVTHAKFCVNRLGGFSAAALPKVPFPILIQTTLTTVLHCRAGCSVSAVLGAQSHRGLRILAGRKNARLARQRIRNTNTQLRGLCVKQSVKHFVKHLHASHRFTGDVQITV